MNQDEFERLQEGDIVRHKIGGKGYIVTANYGGRATAVRTVDLTNPQEWDLIVKSNHSPLGSNRAASRRREGEST